MEFGAVVRRRKMVRTFLDRPVDPDVLQRILENGQRAPSAGYTQGFEFLVLEGPDQTRRFWGSVATDEGGPGAGVRAAPVLVVPLASKKAYLDRYAEEDKGWDDRDESRWPMPFWYVDAAFASMLILLSAVDEGLGALFFGLFPPALPEFMSAFGIPDEWEPIGVIALGHPAPKDPVKSSAHSRPRKPLNDIVHRGAW
jgi:nitroreductase